MTAASDKFEIDIAKAINAHVGIKAVRPPADDVRYSDILVSIGTTKTWVEVKMDHAAQMGSSRVFYNKRKWQTTYKSPAAQEAVDLLNKSLDAAEWLRGMAAFTGIPHQHIKIPTRKSELRVEGAVPYKIMQLYFKQHKVNQYVASKENFELGPIVTKHYIEGKAAPAYYMQAGDDFYRISNRNPLKLTNRIPLLKGMGSLRVRIAMRKPRDQYYEVQAEIKIAKMPESKYSIAPDTKKINPFIRA